MHMTDKIVVLSTCASRAEAAGIARGLVEKRLAACVSIVKEVQSVYRWKDADGKEAIEEAEEFLLIIKSKREKLPQLKTQLAQMHSYEVPEIVALPIVDGSDAYLSWIDRELAEEPAE